MDGVRTAKNSSGDNPTVLGQAWFGILPAGGLVLYAAQDATIQGWNAAMHR